jgi:hypothetical protein
MIPAIELDVDESIETELLDIVAAVFNCIVAVVESIFPPIAVYV